MSKSDGYATFSGKNSGKPPSGLFGWCCACCFPKPGDIDCFPLEKTVVKKHAYVCGYDEVPQSKEAADVVDGGKVSSSQHASPLKVGSVKTGAVEHKNHNGRNLGKIPDDGASSGDALENQYGIPERPWAPATKVLPTSDSDILGLPAKTDISNESSTNSREFENPLADIISDDKNRELESLKEVDDSDCLEFENPLAQSETNEMGKSNVESQPRQDSANGSVNDATKQPLLGQQGDKETALGETTTVLEESLVLADLESEQNESLGERNRESITFVDGHESVSESTPICNDKSPNPQENDRLATNSIGGSALVDIISEVVGDEIGLQSSLDNTLLNSELGPSEGQQQSNSEGVGDNKKKDGSYSLTGSDDLGGDNVDVNATGGPEESLEERNRESITIVDGHEGVSESSPIYYGENDKRRKSSHTSPPTVGLNLSVISEGQENHEDLHRSGYIPFQKKPQKGTQDEGSISEEAPLTPGGAKPAEWVAPEEDIDRLVAIHQHRTSLSSLGARSDSLASVYSGAGEGRYGTVTVRGEVEFSLTYNYKAGALEITVKQCRDLAPVDVKRNRSDPYVKVYLLPDKSKSGKRKTKVKKHTLNPVFDETLKFAVKLDGLESRTLWLTVWHSDMFGRNDFLGEVMMSLENKVFDDPSPRFYPLSERTEPFEDLAIYKGDIIIGLKFVPPDVTVVKKGKRSRGSLHVLVKEAKNLTAVKASGLSDPFCKCYLLPDKGRSSKQKTPVIRRNCSPAWNYTFVYEDVSLQDLSERCLELTVWDHDRLASNEFLGGLRFSLGTAKHFGKPVDWMDASGKELTLWQSMLERPNFWVEGSIALRPSLDHPNAPS